MLDLQGLDVSERGELDPPPLETAKARERREAKLALSMERVLRGARSGGGNGGGGKGGGASQGGGGGDGGGEPGWVAVRRMLFKLADEFAAKEKTRS